VPSLDGYAHHWGREESQLILSNDGATSPTSDGTAES